ncbi:vespryn-like [Podarcis raffonei]|uniref:vespryn-like n=1 Tax=Podarcis raffonei TaxID=65483 RepID=UPI0023299225|nr:vespryn-like [Podarcis raffonei]XP_053235018.1 vespryn-like [Podarcis raffonei]
MSFSLVSWLSFRNFPMRSGVQPTLKGFYCILWLMLCFLAEQKGGGKVLASLPRGCYRVAAKVTFNPDTAHPALVVSTDRKTVTSEGVEHPVPPNPKRFTKSPAVLGSPGFKSGKHCWEVVYGNQREWAVGVARESVKRDVYLSLTPEEGIVQEGLWWLRRRQSDPQPPPQGSGTIGVLLDCDQDTVTFYMAGKVIKKDVPRNGEVVYPFFYVGGDVSLRLNDLKE